MTSNGVVDGSKDARQQGWKTLIPCRSIPRDKQQEIPVGHVGLFSFLVYGWLDGFMWKAFSGRIDRSRMWTCPETDSARINADRLEMLWKEEIDKCGSAGASLPRVLFRFIKRRWLLAALLLVISTGLLLFSVAYIMMNILQLTVREDAALWHGLVLVGALFLVSILSQLLFIASVTITHVAAGRLRGAILCLLFRKLIKITSLHDKTIGKVVNLYSNDSIRVFDGMSMCHMILSGPVLVIGSTAYAIYLLGAWALIGLVILLLILPLQMSAGKLLMRFRGRAILLTDSRVRMMTEYLSSIRFIKMYSWEKAIIRLVEGARAAEQKVLTKANITMSILFTTAGILISIATMCTLIAYTMSGNHLSSAQGFMYLLVYTCIYDRLELCMISIKLVSEHMVAAKRFQEILLLHDQTDRSSVTTNSYRAYDGPYAMELKELTFRWQRIRAEVPANGTKMNNKSQHQQSKSAGSREANEELQVPLVEIEEEQIFGKFNLNIERGQVVGIMGAVSSGKTSLIRAILGQMEIVEGNVGVCGSLAYVPQQPWIFNATVRENILLGSPFDDTKYKTVLELCCLEQDLEALVDGDMTEIGERGVTLSGGQKQRISLARALYSDRDVYLLDDPLASVDPDVAEKIFKNVVLGHLLGKTVLLVTHQVKFFSQCDLIIRLNERQLQEMGSHDDLMQSGSDYASLVDTALTSKAKIDRSPDQIDVDLPTSSPTVTSSASVSTDLPPKSTDGNATTSSEKIKKSVALIKEEEKAEGAISCSTYLAYLKAGGGFPALLVIVLVSVLAELFKAFSFWWLAYWLEDGSGGTVIYDNDTNTTTISDSISDNPRLWIYNLVYGMSLVAILIFFTIRSVVVVKILMRASSKLHDQLFRKVMRTSILFFDTTPLGRLINRFSRDTDEMDSRLPMLIENTLKSFLNILIYLALISVIMPWFLVAIPLAGALFVILYIVFRAGVRELQRLQLISMSPLLSHVDATLRGLSSIQAYEKMNDFEVKFRHLLDHNTAMLCLSNFAARWVGCRLIFLTTTLVTCTALLIFLLRDEIPTAYCGAAIIYSFQLLTLFQLFVRFAVDTGATFASTERIHSYITELKEEGMLVTKTFALPKEWPSSGQIQFSEVNLRYREELPLVLKNISFLVKPMEKIGIVGRTGSGKSSLVGSLFRLIEATGGKIEIDGIDISLIGLEELRMHLSIIPQDPVLFSGTIRTNLDPFNHNIDHELWHILERCHIKDMVTQMDGQLSAKIFENGENLSQGERQLLCIARVLLRRTRIIVLDEATASLDDETQTKIQMTINETFKDCTVLIIAHRLRTVLSCDRVLVLEDGKIIEFDKPSSLLNNPNSSLRKMVSAEAAATAAISNSGALTDADTKVVWV